MIFPSAARAVSRTMGSVSFRALSTKAVSFNKPMFSITNSLSSTMSYRKISIWPGGSAANTSAKKESVNEDIKEEEEPQQQQKQKEEATQTKEEKTEKKIKESKKDTTTSEKPSEESVKILELQKSLKEKDEKLAQVSRMYRSALADAENVRRRSREEVENTKQFAISKFAKELLEVSDVLHMALEAVPQEHREDSDIKALADLYVGVKMTRDNFIKTMARFGVHEFDPLDEEFDPNMHQALFQQPIPGKKSGTVFSVAKSGFRIGERCLRPAQVGVVKHQDE